MKNSNNNKYGNYGNIPLGLDTKAVFPSPPWNVATLSTL